MRSGRKPDGSISSYLACFLMMTVSLQQSNGAQFPEEDLIENEPVARRGRATLPCLVIQSTSAAQTTRPTVPINLMDLLNNGSRATAQEIELQIKDAILVMGNMGSGKDMLIRLLTKDLGGLTVGLTNGIHGNMVFIDTNDGLKATPTTSSKVIPELVIKQESANGTTTAFYDFPYFDESHGPEQNIAANYFMKQTMSKLARVKIIFTVSPSAFNFNSTTSGAVKQDNQGFDYLVNNATNFLMDIPTYRKSFGLVVTKVSGTDDKLVMDGIVQFLTTYLDNLHSQLFSNSALISRSILYGKIQFVLILLQRDQQGKYARIHLSRSPTQCGPLSHSREATEAKERITELYSETLQYAKVNHQDLGDTLTSKSKLVIMNSLSTLNLEISTQLEVLMGDFKSWHDNLIIETSDLVNKWKKLVATTETFGQILASTNNLGNNSTSEKLMEGIVLILGRLGYNVSHHDEQNLKRNLNYLSFFEDVSGIPTTMFKEDWKLPIANFAAQLEKEERAVKETVRSLIPMNQIITAEVTALVSNFTECYLHQISEETDWAIKLRLTQEANGAIREVITQMDGLGDEHYPQDFAVPLVTLLDKLGCCNSSAFRDATKQAQVYFKYDEEINPPGVPRAIKDWVAPVAELSRRFQYLEETTELSYEIYKRETEIAGLLREMKDLQESHAHIIKDLSSRMQLCGNNVSQLNYSGLHLTAMQMDWQSLKFLVGLGEHLTTTQLHELAQFTVAKDIAKICNVQDINGVTPLMLAVKNVKVDMETLALLRGNGVDVNIIDGEARSLRYYIKQGRQNLGLLSELPQLGTRDVMDLRVALQAMSEPAVKTLLKLGADVNLQVNGSEAPLHIAAGSNNSTFAINVIKSLIQNGANPMALDGEGQVFLHKLVAHGTTLTGSEFQDLAEFLVAQNLSNVFNVKDKIDGKTPFMSAVENLVIHGSLFHLLSTHGVDINLVDNIGNSPMAYIDEGGINGDLRPALVRVWYESGGWTGRLFEGNNHDGRTVWVGAGSSPNNCCALTNMKLCIFAGFDCVDAIQNTRSMKVSVCVKLHSSLDCQGTALAELQPGFYEEILWTNGTPFGIDTIQSNTTNHRNWEWWGFYGKVQSISSCE